jgi:hypothetical protein
MNKLKLSPIFISAIILAAHFMYNGLYILLIICIFPALLLIKRKWSVIIIQFILILASLEWVRTLIFLAGERQGQGLPWTRLAIILGCVAAFTALSALVFKFKSLKKIYNP